MSTRRKHNPVLGSPSCLKMRITHTLMRIIDHEHLLVEPELIDYLIGDKYRHVKKSPSTAGEKAHLQNRLVPTNWVENFPLSLSQHFPLTSQLTTLHKATARTPPFRRWPYSESRQWDNLRRRPLMRSSMLLTEHSCTSREFWDRQ